MVVLLRCFEFCMVSYYLYTDYLCWISRLVSHLIHLTCECVASLFVSVMGHGGAREWEHLGGGRCVHCVGEDEF